MISIRKYLYRDSEKAGPALADAPGSTETLQGFAVGVLECIVQHVLSGELSEPTRSSLLRLKEELRPDWTRDEASHAVESVDRVLAQHKAALQKNATTQAVEMQHIFAMLNQALIVLADGKDRSISRLNRVQESLQHACMIEDIVALKFSLADTMRFVKAESVHAQESSTKELARLEKEVMSARQFLGNSQLDLAGRPEGVRQITESLNSTGPGEGTYLVAFLFDRLQAIQQRYGPSVAEEVVFRFIRERLQPVAPGGALFRWNSSSLTAVFNRPRDLAALRTEVTNLNNTPLVHRISLGNRTAVLTIKASYLVAEGTPGNPNQLVEAIDQFAGVCQ